MIQEMRITSTRKTIVSENMKEKINVSESYLRKKRLGILAWFKFNC